MRFVRIICIQRMHIKKTLRTDPGKFLFQSPVGLHLHQRLGQIFAAEIHLSAVHSIAASISGTTVHTDHAVVHSVSNGVLCIVHVDFCTVHMAAQRISRRTMRCFCRCFCRDPTPRPSPQLCISAKDWMIVRPLNGSLLLPMTPEMAQPTAPSRFIL